jgi:hypothetical protein
VARAGLSVILFVLVLVLVIVIVIVIVLVLDVDLGNHGFFNVSLAHPPFIPHFSPQKGRPGPKKCDFPRKRIRFCIDYFFRSTIIAPYDS